ncbi:MAG TPA: hypothetical protein VMR34_03510 [Candidatus Saccharimonadales bacterium]|nr:hypothetical protein [Candidatus Saccharimonadales bacterium]
MAHTIFVITGFKFSATAASKEYEPLRKMLTGKGYKVVPVDINWRRKTVSQFSDEFIDIYRANKTEHNTVLGNSFGAMVVFVTAPVLNPNIVIIGSLSPFFKEDLSSFSGKELLRRFGKGRIKDFKILSATDIANKINGLNIDVEFVYGEKETTTLPELMHRVRDSAKRTNKSKLHELKNAPHSMRRSAYIDGLSKTIKNVK